MLGCVDCMDSNFHYDRLCELENFQQREKDEIERQNPINFICDQHYFIDHLDYDLFRIRLIDWRYNYNEYFAGYCCIHRDIIL